MTIAPERGDGTCPVDFTTTRLVLPGGLLIAVGAGTPETFVTAPVGSLYLNSTGTSANTTAYVKRTGAGATGWFPVTA